jgi:thioredoxin reductase (NADPH)
MPLELSEVASPDLSHADMAYIEEHGTRRHVEAGEYLYRAGDEAYDFYAIVSGAVEIVVGTDDAEWVIVRHGPGRFLGELNLLTGLRVFVSARVTEPGDVLVLPRDRIRRVIAAVPGLGDKILGAFLERRSILLAGAAVSIRVVGSRFSPESLRVREFLVRNQVPHQWLDAESDPDVGTLLGEFGVTAEEMPVVITATAVLRQPNAAELADYLGLTLRSFPERVFDLVIVGGGPAGLAAAVYGASEGLQSLVVDMDAVGGQAGSSSRIENYLGFPMGISGGDLAQRAVVQAEKFGARLTSPCAATSLREEGGYLVVRLSDGTDIAGRAVVVASGASYRRLAVARLEQFEGNGVYYAATDTEARVCSPAPVAVVGGGNSAGQAALFLAASGSAVSLVIRGTDLGEKMSRYLVDRIETHARIDVRTQSQIVGLEGERTIASVRIAGPDGETHFPCSGLFSFIGADPASDWIGGCAALDDHGFVLTDRQLGDRELGSRWETEARLPLPFETSHPGLFAVGDVRSGSVKRVAAAVGEGSTCVSSVHRYLTFAH